MPRSMTHGIHAQPSSAPATSRSAVNSEGSVGPVVLAISMAGAMGAFRIQCDFLAENAGEDAALEAYSPCLDPGPRADVGLPDGQMGNFFSRKVGHLTIGFRTRSNRQELVRISKAVKDGQPGPFNPAWNGWPIVLLADGGQLAPALVSAPTAASTSHLKPFLGWPACTGRRPRIQTSDPRHHRGPR